MQSLESTLHNLMGRGRLRGVLVLCCLLAACAGSPPAPPRALPDANQEIRFKVLDSRDRPLAGVKIYLTPVQGRPRTPGHLITDETGQASVTWAPQVIDETKGTHIQDQVLSFLTRADYKVEAGGYTTVNGVIQGRDTSQQVISEKLKTLSHQAALRPLAQVVVLRGRRDLLGGDLAKRSLQDPLVKRCLAFHRDLQPVALQLGADFAWPAFVLKGSHLSLHFDWKGVTWGGLDPAPLKAKVAVSAGMPLALACGEELLPLAGVKTLELDFFSETLPPKEPHAMPIRAAVIISAPVSSFRELAKGGLSPDQFMLSHPPVLREFKN